MRLLQTQLQQVRLWLNVEIILLTRASLAFCFFSGCGSHQQSRFCPKLWALEMCMYAQLMQTSLEFPSLT